MRNQRSTIGSNRGNETLPISTIIFAASGSHSASPRFGLTQRVARARGTRLLRSSYSDHNIAASSRRIFAQTINVPVYRSPAHLIALRSFLNTAATLPDHSHRNGRRQRYHLAREAMMRWTKSDFSQAKRAERRAERRARTALGRLRSRIPPRLASRYVHDSFLHRGSSGTKFRARRKLHSSSWVVNQCWTAASTSLEIAGIIKHLRVVSERTDRPS